MTHQLLAPYVLDALEPAEEHDTERHLDECEECRRELAPLREAAGALAFAVDDAEPPPELYRRIRACLRAADIVPLRRRATVVTAGMAAAAVALAIWATSLSQSLDRERTARGAETRLAAVLASPAARTVPLEGQPGTLVVAPSGDAALLVTNLTPAGPGRVYEAWVIERGRPRPAGLLEGGPGRSALALARPVPRGATVAVTLEERGDVERPTPPVLFAARAI